MKKKLQMSHLFSGRSDYNFNHTIFKLLAHLPLYCDDDVIQNATPVNTRIHFSCWAQNVNDYVADVERVKRSV